MDSLLLAPGEKWKLLGGNSLAVFAEGYTPLLEVDPESEPLDDTPEIAQARLRSALHDLKAFPSDSIDAVICDPPYSSGGAFRNDRSQDPAQKYVQTGTDIERMSFSGDNRDQRSWIMWMSLWIEEATRLLKPGGKFLCFTDWRQLPATTDAMQAGGIVWRGIISWNKGRGSRAPHTGYFRHQCEYCVWGTRGALDPADWGGPWDGCFTVPVLQSDKWHMTGKPTELMRELAQCVPPGGIILDPFNGSASTGVGALQAGRRYIGIEKEPGYLDISRRRLEHAAANPHAPALRVKTASEQEAQIGFGNALFEDPKPETAEEALAEALQVEPVLAVAA